MKDNNQPVIKNSYSLNLLIRLNDYKRVINETSIKIAQLKKSSLVKIEASSKVRELQIKKELITQKISLYKTQIKKTDESINKVNEFNQNLKIILAKTNEKLITQHDKLDKDKEKLILLDQNVTLLNKSYLIIEEKLKRRQKQMIFELSRIFHIEIIEPLNDGKQRFKLKLINLNFKNTGEPKNDQQNEVIIGYVAHAVKLISTILNLPLRYPVLFRASKSYVIEQMNNENACQYPLFKQNSVQENAFSDAVMLLNKNLSQLRILFDNYHNVDPNDMLGNLKWIFDYFKFSSQSLN